MPESQPAVGAPVQPSVRPSLLTERELLDIVDQLIRDRAYNRPAAVAIGLAVGAAVEAEVRERCARICESLLGLGYRDDGSDAWMGHDNALRSAVALIRTA